MKLSISKAASWNLCEFRFYLERIQKWKETTKKPWLHYGSSIDELLAILDEKGLEAALNKIPDFFTDPYDQVDAGYILTQWMRQFMHEQLPPIVLDGQPGNQYQLNTDLGEDVELYGFIDKVNMQDKQIAFTERKTTSSAINPTSVYWNKLDLDPQITGYSHGLSEGRFNPISICNYEVIRKPSKTLSVMFDRDKATSLEDYKERVFSLLTKPPKQTMIARRKVYITSDRREWWLSDHMHTARRIRLAEVEFKTYGERAYRRNTNSCDAFGGCPFRKYCSGKCDLNRIEGIKQGE